jgi:hypothetical protein
MLHGEVLDSDRYSTKWVREDKMSSSECARLLYDEIESLIREDDVFHVQYGLLLNHYRKLSKEVMAA